MFRFISILCTIVFFTTCTLSAQNEAGSENPATNTSGVEGAATKSTDIVVYYFHATRRCATCEAVEEVTRKALIEFGDTVCFSAINREKDENSELVEKFEISGQTLLFVKADEVVDLTNYAFLNARSHPDKLKARIKETIDSMM